MKKDKKKFSLFNYPLDGKGVSKDENEERNLLFFFKLLPRRFNTLLSVNLLLVFGNFPVFFIILAFSGYLSNTSYAPASKYFGPIYGATLLSGETTASSKALLGVHGVQIETLIPTTAAYVFAAVGIVLLLFTFGLTVAGTTYIVRNAVKGEPIFLMQDFFRTVKRNWKQALPFGAFDLILCGMIVYSLYFYAANRGSYGVNVMFFACIAIGIIYFVMRFYVYTMMVTFDLSVFKLLKNAFIFSIIGFKRNFMGFIGIAFVAFFNYFLLNVFLPLGMLLPFMMTLAICQFMAVYAAWPKIYEIMVEPYEKKDDNAGGEEEEPIFTDDVTQKKKIEKLTGKKS